MKLSKDPFETPAEFERFRWQTAAKILAGMLSNPVLTKSGASTFPYTDETLAGWAVNSTDELIGQLAGKKDEVRWRLISKSPDFQEDGTINADGVKMYKGKTTSIPVVLSKDGVLTSGMAVRSRFWGDSWYLTFDDLMKLPKEK